MAARDDFEPWWDSDTRVGVTYQPAVPPTPAAGGPARRRSFWRRSVATRRDGSFWRHAFILVVVLLSVMVLVRTFVVQLDDVPGGAMQPTLHPGDRVLINRVAYNFRDPRRGELVLFHGTTTWVPDVAADPHANFLSKVATSLGDVLGVSHPGPHDFIRRVIGVPGDTVACCDADGRIIINGAGIDEPYATLNAPIDSPPGTPPCARRPFTPVVVQPGYVFVLGDDRLISQDSRCVGPVPIEDIVGRAIAVAWPYGHWSWLSVPPSFSQVPPP